MPATYEPIASQTLGSNAASITFSDISGSFTDLVLVLNGTNTNDNNYLLRLNGDTGSNYSTTRLGADSSGAWSDRASNATSITLSNGTHTNRGLLILNVMSYSNTNVNKTVLNQSAIGTTGVGRQVGLWRSTAAVTSVTILVASNNIASGTTASLFGIKAAA